MNASLSNVARRLPALAFLFFFVKGLVWLAVAACAVMAPGLI